ncbi:MAG: PIN domain-containing protein, partial [Xanthobacteraceae bacterium]
MYLVDTNVISASAPSKAVSTAELLKWMDDHSARLYLSAVTVAEIEDGIAKARRERARRKAADLTAWLDTLLHLYGDRVLAFDVRAARIAGALSDLARS